MVSIENRWSLIHENVVAALKTLPFPEDVTIDKLARPAGIDALLGSGNAIGVCLGNDRWIPNPGGAYGEVGDHEDQPAEMTVLIVIAADSALDSTDALDAEGAIRDLSRIALRVRNIDVGIYGKGEGLDTGGVFLDSIRSDLVDFPGREPGGAGPLSKVFTLKTTELPL